MMTTGCEGDILVRIAFGRVGDNELGENLAKDLKLEGKFFVLF
jgi:hypothetical protein